jgi:hypothetical protein
MSRGSRANHPSGPPALPSRGIPRRNQNPDPAFFGRRSQGGSRDPHAQEVQRFASGGVVPRGFDLEVRHVINVGPQSWYALEESAPEQRTISVAEMRDHLMIQMIQQMHQPAERNGRGWSVTVTPGVFNDKRTAKIVFDELVGDEVVSDDDIADILAKAAEMITRKKINEPSALHPGARKRRLTI